MRKYIASFNLCIIFCIISPFIVNASVSESGVIDVLVEEDIKEDIEEDIKKDVEDIVTVSESEVDYASVSNTNVSSNVFSDSDSSSFVISELTTEEESQFQQNVLFAIYGVAGIIAFMCGIVLAIILAFAIKDLGV